MSCEFPHCTGEPEVYYIQENGHVQEVCRYHDEVVQWQRNPLLPVINKAQEMTA